MRYAQGDPMVFIERPLSGALVAASVLLLLVVLLPMVRRKREDVFAE
jgi:putative tricarboxylic transport membrane protein